MRFEAAFRLRLADDAQELARDNDVLILALPAYGHKAVMDAIAPHVRDTQHVIISSHASLGAIYLAQLLDRRGVTAAITAWGTTAVTARRQSGTEVRINTVRRLIDLCTVPDRWSQEVDWRSASACSAIDSSLATACSQFRFPTSTHRTTWASPLAT